MLRSHALISAPRADAALARLCGACAAFGTAHCHGRRGCAEMPSGRCSMIASGGSLHLLCESPDAEALRDTEAAIAACLDAAPEWQAAI